MDLISRFIELQQIGVILAPPEFWLLPPDKVEGYGCGPGKLGDYFVPDSLWGQTIKLACEVHDHQYEVGKTQDDKKFADLLFLINMVSIITATKEFFDAARLDLAMTYYKAVHLFGGDAFGYEELNA